LFRVPVADVEIFFVGRESDAVGSLEVGADELQLSFVEGAAGFSCALFAGLDAAALKRDARRELEKHRSDEERSGAI